ncbi:MAG: imidazole glycerol phosphate synthase subunit HisH [Bacteroidota bacterium]
MIVIIDYEAGNVGSIKNMFKKLGCEAKISSDPADINVADKLILPGVGAFDYGMSKLHEHKLVELLNRKVLIDKTPILGICLGVQLLTKGSEEGQRAGLGWFDAKAVKFRMPDTAAHLKVPHMGWNEVRPVKATRLFRDMPEEPRFYFVHSYYLEAGSDVMLTAHYGIDFACGLEKENIAGVQFHPEKSHQYGLTLLKNFAELY